MDSPLTQVGASKLGSPDPAMNPQGALAASVQRKQDYLSQQQAAYNREMEQYAQMVEQSRMPESNEAAMWGSVAAGASRVPPVYGNFGAMLGSMGSSLGNFEETQQQTNLKNQRELTQTRQAELRALESRDQFKALYGTGKMFEFRQNADKTTTVFNNRTGMPVGTFGPQDINRVTQLTETLAKAAFEKGEYKTLDEAMEWASAEAIRRVAQFNENAGNRRTPLAGDVGGLPTTQPPRTAPPQSSTPLPTPATQATAGTTEGTDRAAILGEELAKEAQASKLAQESGDQEAVQHHNSNLAQLSEMIGQLPPEQRADVERNFQRYISNPNPGTQKGVEASLVRTGALPKRDIQRASEMEGYGKKMGAHMADTSVDLQKTGAAASTIIGDLTTLENLYSKHGENIPEGFLAPWISNVKSSAKSLGVDVLGQGPADVINALATKQALQSRTADGTNLLPGAMSNYEDRLLQSTAPGLAQSHEGRLLLIQIMKVQLGMKTKLAELARDYVSKNGRLDEGWFSIAAEEAKKNPFLDPQRLDALEAYAARLANKQGAK